MNGEIEFLTMSELLSLRSDLRADIRSLDDLNFKIISTISTVTLGIITAGTALKNPDYVVFLFASLALLNCMAAMMLLKNRISVLEKTWYVCYLESKLPNEHRKFSPFGFEHFDEPMPKNVAYRFMIRVHMLLIFLGFVWTIAALTLFYESSRHIFANFVVLLCTLLKCELSPNLGLFFHLDYFVWLVVLALFGLYTRHVWKNKVMKGYEEKWQSSIWAKKRPLLKSLKKLFVKNGNKE